jgi:hypothetical protein
MITDREKRAVKVAAVCRGRCPQRIVNAAPTAGEGARVAGMISALVCAGIKGSYLANPRLAKVGGGSAGNGQPTVASGG